MNVKTVDKLFIIESPNKIKTLESILDDSYSIIASVGHIRNIEPKNNSINIVKNKLKINWVWSKAYSKFEKNVLACKNIKTVYIGTDHDLEGERIANDIKECLIDHLDSKIKVQRIRYNEISKQAIEDAITAGGNIDKPTVDAALGRLCFDYIFGFGISPVLWQHVKGAKSAGRVQSPSLSLIINAFLNHISHVPVPYFLLRLNILLNNVPHTLEFNEKFANKKPLLDKLKNLYNDIKVIDIKKEKVKTIISNPLTTADLQKRLNRKYGWSGKFTMSVAQQLYEGIKITIGNKTKQVGLTTYIRTDSTYISKDFCNQFASYLKKHYDIPSRAIVFKKNDGAHECIRPTNIHLEPKVIKHCLTKEQLMLYEFIYYHTAKYVLVPPVIDLLKITIGNQEIQGNLESRKYIEVNSDIFDNKDLNTQEQLYDINQSSPISIDGFNVKLSKTNKPPLLNESSLITLLQKLGIGKPSTYANITEVLINRKYIVRKHKTLVPTKLGIQLHIFLRENFNTYVDTVFTANMESVLDNIKNGNSALEKEVESFIRQMKADTTEKRFVSGTRQFFIDEIISRSDKYFTIWKKGDYSIRYQNCFVYLMYKNKLIKNLLTVYGNMPKHQMAIFAVISFFLRTGIDKLQCNKIGLFVNEKRIPNFPSLKHVLQSAF